MVNHLSQIGSFVGGICAGAVGGSLVTLKVSRKNQADGSSSITDQTGAHAGGDLVGRDKSTILKR
ncbi:hypothetical protein FNL55_25065 [Tardiphaga sp. vice352]|nr:hypothetical protein FIU28_24375 [Tardiphaga sp. vice154]QDM34947.1 hypothetical protein FNL55_25065 [Tardiphaga sp. vice352]